MSSWRSESRIAAEGIVAVTASDASRPLAGRRGWLITDGKIGMDV